MKKLIASLLVLVLVLSLVACGSSDDTDDRINVSESSTDIKGKDYKDAMTLLQVAGFTNIELEVLDDLITGSLTKDGEVEKVSINGDTDFSESSKYEHDATIVITYHTFPVVLDTAKLSAGPLDLNAINSTNSAESDAEFVGKYYMITGIIEQAMEPSDGYNALVIIQPDVMAKGMESTLPLEINIWLTADEFESIGGISSIGKQIDISVKLTTVSRNAMSKDPAVKGYPIQLEFGEYN